MSRTVRIYLAALLFRCGMFFYLLYTCLRAPTRLEEQLYHVTWRPNVVNVFWLILMLTMLWRFFPSNSENLGHEKQFSSYFCPTDNDLSTLSSDLLAYTYENATMVLFRLLFSGVWEMVFFFSCMPQVILISVSYYYSVQDMPSAILFVSYFTVPFKKSGCTIDVALPVASIIGILQ